MFVNGKKYDIDDLMSSIKFDDKYLKKCGNIMLTDYEISVLERYHIDYKSSTSLNDLRMKIEYYLEDDEFNDLECVLDQITERSYYQDINK